MTPRISIVTVVFNCVLAIEHTLKSVIEQTYSNLEYIVIDGGSDDGTLQIVSQYSRHINYFVSEKDFGVYHAMNKAIEVASGDWILFMNAGDVFSCSSVIENVFVRCSYCHKSVIYGGHRVLYGSGRERMVLPRSRLFFWKGSQFSHQAVFIPLSYHKSFPYDLRYKIAADYAFFLQARSHGVKFKRVDLIVATITAHGLSDTQRIRSVVERSRALDSMLFTFACLPVLLTYTYAVQFAKKLFVGFIGR